MYIPRIRAAVGISLSFIWQPQSLEFFWNPEWDFCRNLIRLSNRFLFNSSCSCYTEHTKLYGLLLAIIWCVFLNLGKKTVMNSIPKITCKSYNHNEIKNVFPLDLQRLVLWIPSLKNLIYSFNNHWLTTIQMKDSLYPIHKFL